MPGIQIFCSTGNPVSAWFVIRCFGSSGFEIINCLQCVENVGIQPSKLHAVLECLLDDADIAIDREPSITLFDPLFLKKNERQRDEIVGRFVPVSTFTLQLFYIFVVFCVIK